MSIRIRVALTGLALVSAGLGAAAHAVPAPRVSVSVLVVEGFAGRLYCLTPDARGKVTLPAHKVPRRLCLKSGQWAQRGVVMQDG